MGVAIIIFMSLGHTGITSGSGEGFLTGSLHQRVQHDDFPRV